MLLRVFLPALLLFTPLVFLIPRFGMQEAPSVYFMYQYNLNAETNDAVPVGWERPVFNAVIAESEEGLQLLGPDMPPLALEDNEQVFVPFLGQGYFSYARVGSAVRWKSRRGEELWNKQYFSYPVSDEQGRLVFLLTGDNNRVDVIDPNGNAAPVPGVAGNFMIDYDFAAESGHGFILFAGGQLRVLNPDGTLRAGFDYEADEDEQPVFFKSCAIAPDGATLAVHALMENADRILVFEIRQNEARLRETDDFTLPGIYPHLLHMAVNAHGVLVAAPDRTLLFGLQGQDDLDEPFENPEGGIYRPVLAGRDYFVYASGLQEVRVLDADGFEMVRVPLTATGVRYNLNTWRILAGREPRVFVLHSPDRLDFYRVQEFAR